MKITSIEQAEDTFIQDMVSLNSRILRFEYLLSYTEDVLLLPMESHNADTKVAACASNAWVSIEAHANVLTLRADSDSLIVKGLLGVLSSFVNGRQTSEIAGWQPRFLEIPQLKRQLTVDRHHGIETIVTEVCQKARIAYSQDVDQ